MTEKTRKRIPLWVRDCMFGATVTAGVVALYFYLLSINGESL